MKQIFILLSVLSISMLVASCKKEKSEPAEFKTVVLTEKQKQLSTASNAFGFEFFKKVNEVSGNDVNLMVSPLSVSMALGMTRNGAAGTTLQAMTNTLGFEGMSDEEINQSYKYIIETFTGLDPKVKLQIANSIWYDKDFSAETAFVTTNQTNFGAEVTKLDFSNASAAVMINAWVKEKTNSLIPEIIDQIPAEAVMYLINAVYFKGQWKYQFEKDKTVQKPFYLSGGSTIQVQAMHQHETLPYFKGAAFQAVTLPYNQGNYNMTVLLPDAGKTVNDVITSLSQENWNAWIPQFSEADIQLQIPKFKYTYEEKQIKPVLAALGMEVAFDSNKADFTRINSAGGLYISDIKHKTYIATDEEGTEAAAVTSVEIGYTSVGPDQTKYVTIDRPFVYFISEKSTSTILFIGTVMNPNQE